ncbi:MAG: xanthine dehydrogenase family protein molybdopterin-binding subunit [Candidatus Dormiibacterota bacterium]
MGTIDPDAHRPYIGRPLRRREDEALVTGRGTYVDDLRLPGLLHLAVVRSPVPCGRLAGVDAEAARAMPGVLAVWTAADLPELASAMPDFQAPAFQARPRPLLARGAVHYSGEAVAVVVAETPYAARDAADSVFCDVEPWPAVTEVREAAKAAAPRVHPELPSNLAGHMRRRYGDIDEAFAGAPVVVAEELHLARIMAAAMEPRASAAAYDRSSGGLRVWASTQWVFGVRAAICGILDLAPEQVVVTAPDVGGGFGAKGLAYPEEVLVAIAARRLGRPVRWTASRSEDLATTVHGHGSQLELELAAEPDGRLRGLRGRILHDMGAYASSAVNRTDSMVPHLVSMYRLPTLDVDVEFLYTNCAPVGFIRGGGRPVGNFGIERLMDRLAHRLGIDPVELRRRNLIAPDAMPFDTRFPQDGATIVYDGGDYPALLEKAAGDIDYDGWRAAPPPNQGLGIACCVESTGLGKPEPAQVAIAPDGAVTLSIGSTPHGQGHETTFAQVLADRLGVPIERIAVVAGDSRAVPGAGVTAASRSALEVGNAVALAGSRLRRALLDRAGAVLEADPGDLALDEFGAAVRGTPSRTAPWSALVPEGLAAGERYDPAGRRAWSSGCHAALVELDPETGEVRILRYVIAHDTGQAINPRLLEGQLQGGYAHGVGYALFEETAYEATGNLLSSTFVDYTIPGTPEVGIPELHEVRAPTVHNEEGFKGAGEAGTIAVPGAIANAVEDALRRLGVDAAVNEVPITPGRLLELLRRDA